MAKKLPTPELLRKLLRYEPETGLLFWKERSVDMFTHCKNPERQCILFNAKYTGKEAFTYIHCSGYKIGGILGRVVRSHRVIWAVMEGNWPKHEIDHNDHNRANNKWDNLNDTTHKKNMLNKKKYKNNSNGHVGIYWDIKRGMWRSHIGVNGTQKTLGYFKSKKLAIKSRMNAEATYKYHSNHGH